MINYFEVPSGYIKVVVVNGKVIWETAKFIRYCEADED